MKVSTETMAEIIHQIKIFAQGPCKILGNWFEKTLNDPVGLFTGILAIVTLLMFFEARKTSNFNKMTFKFMRDSERARLTIKGINVEEFKDNYDEEVIRTLSIIITNGGRKPAITVNVKSNLFIINPWNPNDPEPPKTTPSTHSLIMPGEKEVQILALSKKDLWIVGNLKLKISIEYHDVDGRLYKSFFEMSPGMRSCGKNELISIFEIQESEFDSY